ncbi:MAG TPA: hypothetical protein VGO47_11745 [Chlamydiales bacterium]|nr:hypothetical protein [Chlamydiales bacterium]
MDFFFFENSFGKDVESLGLLADVSSCHRNDNGCKTDFSGYVDHERGKRADVVSELDDVSKGIIDMEIDIDEPENTENNFAVPLTSSQKQAIFFNSFSIKKNLPELHQICCDHNIIRYNMTAHKSKYELLDSMFHHFCIDKCTLSIPMI